MAQSFIFGGNTGISYDEVQRKKAMAEQLRMAAQSYAPKNWGEGLNELAKALVAKGTGKIADKAEAQRSAAADAIMASLMGGGGYSPVAAPQGPAMPGNGGVTAAPLDGPEAIAADAMAAIGQGSRIGGGSMSTPVGGGPDLAGVSDAAKAAMARLQEATGQTFDITSGYRDPAHNAAVGGAKHSQHLDGNAFDISTAGMSQPQIEKLIIDARNAGFGGIGIYNGSLHFDVGPQRAWGPSYHADSVPAWAQNALATGVVGGTNAPTPVSGGGGGSPDLRTLMMAMASPALSPDQKQIVAALLGQAQQQSDPMRQLELQKAQLELAQMQNNPAANAPASFQALDMQARAGGLQPGTPEYQSFMIHGGDGMPATFQALDMQAKAAGLVPGTPEYQTFMATRGAGEIAAAKAQGEAIGGAVANLPQAEATAKQIGDLVKQLKGDPYLPNMIGPIDNWKPNLSGDSHRVQAMIDQLKGQAFMDAYSMLKGGGQITEIEGQKATAAKLRMDQAQNLEDFIAALDDFQAAVDAGVEKLRRQGGAAAPTAPAGGAVKTWDPATGTFK